MRHDVAIESGIGQDPFHVGELVRSVKLGDEIYEGRTISVGAWDGWMEDLCSGRICPAVGVVAEAVEEHDCCGGGGGEGCGNQNGWVVELDVRT